MNSESVRKILIGLITNEEFCKEYMKRFPEPIFTNVLGVGLVERWCRNYYTKYNKPIRDNISVGYDKCVRNKTQSPEALKYVEILLRSMSKESDEVEQPPVEYLLDLAVAEANKSHLTALKDQLEDALDRDDPKTALEAYERFKRVERGEELPRFNLLEDVDTVTQKVQSVGAEYILKPSIQSAYEQEFFIQPVRSEYVIYKAKSKGYKTFAMYYTALRAAMQKKNVLLFSLGDLSEAMSLKRLFGLLLKKPSMKSQANKSVRVPHIDCYKNQYNTCMNINRTGDRAYQDDSGNFVEGYSRCTACAKCNKPFPVCITHTMENSGELITDEDVSLAMRALKENMGSDGVFDFYPFSACEKTVKDISDIVGSYFDQGKVIDLVVIDYWAQLKIPAGCERLPMHEQVTQQAVDLKNMCVKYNIACVISDQASIRPTETGMTSDDLLTESSFTGGQNKVTYTSSVVNSSVQREDRKNGTIKLHVSLSRYGFGDTQSDGYILTTCPVALGRFADESFYVTSEHIEEIDKFKKENGLDDSSKKKKR